MTDAGVVTRIFKSSGGERKSFDSQCSVSETKRKLTCTLTRANYSVSVTVRDRGNREVGDRVDKKTYQTTSERRTIVQPLTKQILTWAWEADEYL